MKVVDGILSGRGGRMDGWMDGWTDGWVGFGLVRREIWIMRGFRGHMNGGDGEK